MKTRIRFQLKHCVVYEHTQPFPPHMSLEAITNLVWPMREKIAKIVNINPLNLELHITEVEN